MSFAPRTEYGYLRALSAGGSATCELAGPTARGHTIVGVCFLRPILSTRRICFAWSSCIVFLSFDSVA